jgi:hypothetical protein
MSTRKLEYVKTKSDYKGARKERTNRNRRASDDKILMAQQEGVDALCFDRSKVFNIHITGRVSHT